MPSNNHEQVNEDFILNPEVTYESRDMSARAVVGFLMSLAIGGVILLVALWGIYKYLAGPYWTSQPDRAQYRAGASPPDVKFPEPRLQPDPVADLNKFRAREEEILNSYGWTDQADGKVHIPIEAAIDAVAKSGLPPRPAAPAQAAGQKGQPGATGAAGGINVKQGEGKLPQQKQ